MKNENCNNRSPFITIFTLLGILFGGILYIILKQSREKNIETKPQTKKIPEKSTTKKQSVNKAEKIEKKDTSKKLSTRQEKILALLKEKGEIYPVELKELLPDVSTRTIRRDMTDLEKRGIVQQKGSTKSTYYIYTVK